MILLFVVILDPVLTPDHSAAWRPDGVSVNPSPLANNVGAFPSQVLRLKDMVWVPNLCTWANPRLIEGVDGLTVDDTIFQKAQNCIQDPAKLKCLQLVYGETRMCL